MTTIQKPETQLPDRLSDLIELAVANARRLDRNIYFPESSNWQDYRATEDVCEVCFAGAVMAGTLEHPCYQDAGPSTFTIYNRIRLYALDETRRGNWRRALMACGQGHDLGIQMAKRLDALFDNTRMFRGWEEFDQFLDKMEQVVPILREYGF